MSINPNRHSGMTLVEVLIATAVGSLGLLAMVTIWVFSARNFAAMSNYADLDAQSREAFMQMTKEIRMTKGLTAFSTTNLTFDDYDSTPLSYTYDPAARVLTRTKGGVSTNLLTECDSLTFSIFQRNTMSGSYDQYPATNAAACKLVQVQWTCSRSNTAWVMNTESAQSAKIVIRK